MKLLLICCIIIATLNIGFAFKIEPQVVGGIVLKEKRVPFQISLQYRRSGRHTCGGSILNANWILTAAHCVTSLDNAGPDDFSVRVGSNVLENDGSVHTVKQIITHEKYLMNLNDITLIELNEPIVFSDEVQPIKLRTEEVPIGADIAVYGWGKTSDTGKRSEILKTNTLKVMSQKDCRIRTQLDFEQIICLDHPVGQGVCQGDSGGPAVYEGEVVGVASFVKHGCGGKHPDVYVRISKYIEWIQDKMA